MTVVRHDDDSDQRVPSLPNDVCKHSISIASCCDSSQIWTVQCRSVRQSIETCSFDSTCDGRHHIMHSHRALRITNLCTPTNVNAEHSSPTSIMKSRDTELGQHVCVSWQIGGCLQWRTRNLANDEGEADVVDARRGRCGRRETFSTTRHVGGGTSQRHRGLTFCTVFLRRGHVVQHKMVEAGQACTQLVQKQGRIQHLFGIPRNHVLTAMLESAAPPVVARLTKSLKGEVGTATGAGLGVGHGVPCGPHVRQARSGAEIAHHLRDWWRSHCEIVAHKRGKRWCT